MKTLAQPAPKNLTLFSAPGDRVRHSRELAYLVALARAVEDFQFGEDDPDEGLPDLLRELIGALGAHMKREEWIVSRLVPGGTRSGTIDPVAKIDPDDDENDREWARTGVMIRNAEMTGDAIGVWTDLYDWLEVFIAALEARVRPASLVPFPRLDDEI